MFSDSPIAQACLAVTQLRTALANMQPADSWVTTHLATVDTLTGDLVSKRQALEGR